MTRVLGIDLGTTNSCVAVVEQGSPGVVPIEAGHFTLPSIVAFPAGGGRTLVGTAAKRQAVVNAQNTIYAAKRVIGRSFVDAQSRRAISSFPYPCVEGNEGDVRIRVGGRTWAVQEISALVLAALKQAAEDHFDDEITKAVITVPAYFNDHQRQATRDAGRIAGLEVLRIINEPTAAALAHGFLDGAERRIAVYDLGGGTFDVSVLRVGGGFVEVLSSVGDAFLGGADFDQRVMSWLLERIAGSQHVQISQADVNAMQRLREAAEVARIDLSELPSTKISLPFLTTAADGKPVHVETELSRSDYEPLVEDLIERSIVMLSETITNAELQPEDLDEVLLVGGMTRTPMVRARIEEVCGTPPAAGVHPDLVVAVGASIQGALLTGDAAPVILLDVTPYDLGIATVANITEVVIPKDSSLPTEARKLFTTAKDDQRTVDIVVYQGQGKRLADNQVIGKFSLEGLRPGPRGSVRIEVTFSITADGIVGVTARDLDTGTEQQIKIRGSLGLDENEISTMTQAHGNAVGNFSYLPALDGQ